MYLFKTSKCDRYLLKLNKYDKLVCAQNHPKCIWTCGQADYLDSEINDKCGVMDRLWFKL